MKNKEELDRQNRIFEIIRNIHARKCAEVAQIAREHNRSYDEVAELYDNLRDKRKGE